MSAFLDTSLDEEVRRLTDLLASACAERDAADERAAQGLVALEAYRLAGRKWLDNKAQLEAEHNILAEIIKRTEDERDEARRLLAARDDTLIASALVCMTTDRDTWRTRAYEMAAVVDAAVTWREGRDRTVVGTAPPGGQRSHSGIMLIDAIDAYRAAPSAQAMEDDADLCAVCGWMLESAALNGCIRGDCSRRPRPDRLYAPERARVEAGHPEPRDRLLAAKDG